MLRIETKGSAFERGLQQGQSCRDLATPWLAANLRELAQRLGVTSPADAVRGARDRVDQWHGRITRAGFPRLIEEAQGIAAGLGLSEAEYFAAAYSHWLLNPAFAGIGCTTVGFRDEEGRPLLGKTDDIAGHELGMNVMETTSPETGYRHVHLHFAGTIWTVAGMNECGVAIAMTGIPGHALAVDGLPSLEALHTILPECASADEAIDHVRALQVNCYGFSLLIGDAAGTMALVEKTGAGAICLPEDPDGFLLHTNDILDPRFAERNPSQQEPLHTNSRCRYDNARQRLRTLARSEAGLMRLLGDRGAKGAVCQQGEDGMHTDFAIVLVPGEKRLVCRFGSPHRFREHIVALETMF